MVLPTGTGKTFVAQLAIADAQRSTLVVVPTIDLMTQWASQLERTFGCHVAMLGGGSHELADLTVATYDSALLSVDSSGGNFGLLIVDECHHLPGQTYRHIAKAAIAPYRLGLSATPERDDMPDNPLEELLGGICFRKEIDEMEYTSRYLSQLDWVGIKNILLKIHHFGDDVVLLCWEAPDKFCHRHILADYINRKTKLEIKEYE